MRKMVASLPANLEASVFVVLRTLATAESLLPQVLGRVSALPAVTAEDKGLVDAGKIDVAPPDRHLVFHDSAMRVVRGPKENRHRPSIDVLFRSAALVYGRRVIGVLLSGSDDDGTAGLAAIRRCGGIAVVPGPVDSEYREMPASAMRAADPDFCDCCRRDRHPLPDRNGTLWELQDGELLRYRCRVGHAYSAESMVAAGDESVERALRSAVRSLEESAALSRRIAQKTGLLREELTRKATEREEHARTLAAAPAGRRRIESRQS